MTFFSKLTSRKGMHIFEWITVFVAVAVGVTLMAKLTKGYWNARMRGQDVQIYESFYDKFPTGAFSNPESGCDCGEAIPFGACGVGDCGPCQKIAISACDVGCNPEICYTPGVATENCPECINQDPCPDFIDKLECWSDMPSDDLLNALGGSMANLPVDCGYGMMIVDVVDCSDPDNPSQIKCTPEESCEFQCEEMSDAFLNFWYFPCNNITPLNNSEEATVSTFVANGGCTGDACEYQCPPGFLPDINGINFTNYGSLPEARNCECPLDGGNPDPYMVEVIGGIPTCVCDGPTTAGQCLPTPPSGAQMPDTATCQNYGAIDCSGKGCCYQGNQGGGCISCMDFCSQFDDNQASCESHPACNNYTPPTGGSGPNGEYVCDEQLVVPPGGGGTCKSNLCTSVGSCGFECLSGGNGTSVCDVRCNSTYCDINGYATGDDYCDTEYICEDNGNPTPCAPGINADHCASLAPYCYWE